MLGMIDEFRDEFSQRGMELFAPTVRQTMSEEELIELLPNYDGWIIGDDPASSRVLEAGAAGNLRALVKWGIGTDNVDFDAAQRLGLPISNTPGVFGKEVADLAMNYVSGLARQSFRIDREIRQDNGWPKPAGISLAGKTASLVGFGDIGRNTAKRLLAADMNVQVYDPSYAPFEGLNVQPLSWPEGLDKADFIIFTAPLNANTRHMFNPDLLPVVKLGVRIVNVGRGPLIDETALIEGLADGTIHSVACDVFENEPLPFDSPLRAYPDNIFGSHNGSNTADAVSRVSHRAIELIDGFLNQ
ncbi:phosphoglycerate dehydrogenase [Altererythrobacter endophyticus]|uniref:Phosphoglycerate dehydrogenase n=2 Tax=Altericroceibacterium endophyticum TaxID=1808508 RepID=A0A6I4T9J6_9SPHN|nr:phosphoglycerate dehydrogenase [Altericroceibacterium endophyticum]